GHVDTNIGGDPLTFLYGKQEILPALESALQGMSVGETSHITLAPEDAYGLASRRAFQEVALEALPKLFRYPGALLAIGDPEAGELLVKVESVDRKKALLNFNHPLSGKTLVFDVRILFIE
ncbi:MAG: FKBP-type peptidyl-prolyl cis-trans isomerase, partial [Chlamydiota bacterium]|nr:FKBP-type peptidyl-prolyl cis-trans isomerase [Chlamydiota bacterium]